MTYDLGRPGDLAASLVGSNEYFQIRNQPAPHAGANIMIGEDVPSPTFHTNGDSRFAREPSRVLIGLLLP